ncbi:MAG: hypothetical protein PHW04_16625, partial [Candidatus Wallbacteria bacterium]|nr:hypothetical protein [Candidatus Wallbacteria bacterium]
VPLSGTPWGDCTFQIRVLKEKEKFLKSRCRELNLNRTDTGFEPLRNMELQHRLTHGDENILPEIYPQFYG